MKDDSEVFCTTEVERMLKNSQTKVIAPIVTLGILEEHSATGRTEFSDAQIRKCYASAVARIKTTVGHNVHFGAKYYDAYGSRMSRYHVLDPIGHLKYRLLPPFTKHAKSLCSWIPKRINEHIVERLGVVPLLADSSKRLALAEDREQFLVLIQTQIDKTPANFEIFTFSVIKVHLEKFACKIYRDTRTAAHDKGVDLSTNFGVVYQVKKLFLHTVSKADEIYAELKLNFDNERLQDGNVILVIDDISKEVKNYLVNMKVQSISKQDVLKLAASFDEPEDRQRVLRFVYEEYRREYSSNV